MEQLSRPYQIALAAIVGLALVWFALLRHHGQGSPVSPAASTAATVKSAPSTSPAASTRVYHGAAPGVEGLTRDIRKAHEAVGASQRNAQQLQTKSAQASGEAGGQTHSTTPVAPATPRSARKPAAKAPHHAVSAAPSSVAAKVEKELNQGKTVLLLFWNSDSVNDRAVRSQLHTALHALGRKVVVHEANAGEIGIFGKVTQEVRIDQTPTILIITPQHLVTTLTGLTDAFSIKQAVREAN